MLPSRRWAPLGLLSAAAVFVSSVSVLATRSGGLGVAAPFAGQSAALAAEPAPGFRLPDVDGGRNVSLASLRGKAVILFFNSIRCPVNQDYAPRVRLLAERYAADERVQFLVVNQDAGRPDGCSRQEVHVDALVRGRPFPTLLDLGGDVARRFGVERTPAFVVIGPDGRVRYRGPFDDSRDPSRVSRHFVADALRASLADTPPPAPTDRAVAMK